MWQFTKETKTTAEMEFYVQKNLKKKRKLYEIVVLKARKRSVETLRNKIRLYSIGNEVLIVFCWE